MTARCDGQGHHFFAPLDDDEGVLPFDPTKARELCDICDERRECLDAEMRYEAGTIEELRFGIYAGFTGPQRYALERRGDSWLCTCGELRDPIDLRAGLLLCAVCDRCGKTSPLPDDGDPR